MRFRLFTILLMLSCCGSSLIAQEQSVSLEQIRASYEQLNYPKTIDLGETYLANNPRVSKQTLVEVLQYVAFSQVALGQEDAAKRTFRSILVTDPAYELNEKMASPKVIRIFQEVKTQASTASPQIQRSASHVILEDVKTGAVLRSIIFPGVGQTYLGQTRGYVYNSIAAISLGVFLYSSIRLPAAHSAYLKATNPDEITNKYNTYNQLYQFRNNALITYLGTWSISLLDVMVLGPSTQPRIGFSPSYSGVNLAVSFQW